MSEVLQCEGRLSILGLDAASGTEALSAMAARAKEAQWVADTFEEAVIAREQSYPTGLPTPIPVAVPHADPEHVLKPGIGVALLAHPVEFGEMGNAGHTVAARAIAMLFITDAHSHIQTLQALTQVFQRPDWHDRASEATNADELAAAINEMMG